MFLGFDIGTSEVKALLLDDAHRVIGVAGSALSVARPAPGHSEQAPQDWWQGTLEAAAALRAAHPREYAAVRAIGLSGQMHGAVLLDASDAVLRPAILWNDTRSAQECEEMMAELPSLAHISGCVAMPGFTAPKLRWVARHEPDVFRRVAMVLLPKDYVRLRMTGEHVGDMSDASGTMWLDIARRAWSGELLALTRLDVKQMPRLVEGSQPSGVLTDAAAQALGLRAGVVVAGGAGDNAASAVGMGVASAGSGFLSLGTSGVLFVATPAYQPNPQSAVHAYCHALPNRWHQMSVMLSAASCLRWASHLLGGTPESQLDAQAVALTEAQREAAPIFLPYLSGERTPHNDADVRGSLHGLTHDTGAAELAYAVIEGVAFGLKDGLRALQAAGTEVTQLSLVGGGARSALWADLLATALDCEIVTHGESAAGGALGAARLGWLATGATEADVCLPPAIDRRFAPGAKGLAAPALAARYERFHALYRRGGSSH
jgi:xylulokinase